MDAIMNDPIQLSWIGGGLPVIVIIMLILIALINSNWIGLITIFIVNIVLLGFWFLLSNNIFNNYHMISLGICFSIFIFLYMFVPMIIYKAYNWYMFIFLLLLLFVDIGIYLKIFSINYITSLRIPDNSAQKPILYGLLLGTLYAALCILIINLIFQSDETNSELAFLIINLDSNKVSCSRPKEQQFKCAVYKNGELLKTI